MGATSFLLLSCLGLAITAQAQECSRPVGGPNMSLKGDDILSQTFPDGTKVSFACDVGYVSAGGSGTITCTAGSWSPVRLQCERTNCGSAGEVANGHVDYSEGTEFGDKIVISCNPGYRLVGRSEITCGVQGWMNRLPVCEVVICDPPSAVADGTFSPNKENYEYREVVQYTCQKDLTLVGSNSLTCSENGTFQPDPPTCTMVKCADPFIENAEWTGGSRPPHRYKDTVTYKCTSGYTMIGAGTLTCGINGQWSPGLPTCQPVECAAPDIKNAERTGGSQPPYRYKDTVTYKCTSGYTMIGAGTLTCGTNGQWSPGLPTCQRMTTPTTTTTTTATTTTTKTTPPRSTKKSKTTPGPTDPPGSGGIGLGEGIGIAFGVICCAGIMGGLYYFGFVKKGSQRDREQVAAKDTETLPLS